MPGLGEAVEQPLPVEAWSQLDVQISWVYPCLVAIYQSHPLLAGSL